MVLVCLLRGLPHLLLHNPAHHDLREFVAHATQLQILQVCRYVALFEGIEHPKRKIQKRKKFF